MDLNGNGNKNGLFLKVVVGALIAGLATAGAGMINLYRAVGILQADSGTLRRLDRLEDLAANIARDRDQRTVILQGLRAEVEDNRRRLDQLERRGR